jgi:tRNA A-37 threonylcarbamoyl transferase component Bud32
VGADSDTVSFNPESFDPLIGTQLLDRYRITRQLGGGGMGLVYEATHVGIGRRVAIKFMREQHTNNAEMMARFEREARLAASVDDEHVVEILDVGEAHGRMFIVMEMLDGSSFAALLAREVLTEHRIATLLAQAARALGAAHAKSIVHRDVKSANLFVIDRGGIESVKVLDFGVSKLTRAVDQPALTQAGLVMGTTEYMSPEQARGEPVDARTDIYSLGVVLYEAAARRRPFDVGNQLETLNRIVASDLVPLQQVNPHVSDHYAAITARAMAHDRDARYATAFDLATELDMLARPPSVAAATPTLMMTVAPEPRPARRSRAWIVAAILLVAAVATGVYLATAVSKPRAEAHALTRTAVSPHDADPRVADVVPNVVEYVPPGSGKLFVYLGGATSTPETGPSEIYDFATTLGYRSIALAVPRGDRPDDVATRLAMLLAYLARTSPSADWGAYVDRGEPRWSRIALAGFGQGATLATELARQHELARVVLFSAPTEPLDAAASATPADRWFAGTHRRDPSRLREVTDVYRSLAIPDAHIEDVSVALGPNRQERAPGLRAKTFVDAWTKLLGDGR